MSIPEISSGRGGGGGRGVTIQKPFLLYTCPKRICVVLLHKTAT